MYRLSYSQLQTSHTKERWVVSSNMLSVRYSHFMPSRTQGSRHHALQSCLLLTVWVRYRTKIHANKSAIDTCSGTKKRHCLANYTILCRPPSLCKHTSTKLSSIQTCTMERFLEADEQKGYDLPGRGGSTLPCGPWWAVCCPYPGTAGHEVTYSYGDFKRINPANFVFFFLQKRFNLCGTIISLNIMRLAEIDTSKK